MSPLAIAVERGSNSIQKILLAEKFGKDSTAPAFIAFTDIGMSPWPVIKRLEYRYGHWFESSPLNPGSRTSTFGVQTTHTATNNAHCRMHIRLARWLLMAHDRIGDDTMLLTQEFLSIMLGVRRPGVTVRT